MRVRNLLIGSILGLSVVAGCDSNKSKDSSADMSKTEANPAAKADAPKVDDKAAKEAAAVAKASYNEVEHGGRIYVTASQESAANAAKGRHPQLAVTKIGFGPKGETVVFEASEGGGVEKKLMAEFKKKHGMQ